MAVVDAGQATGVAEAHDLPDSADCLRRVRVFLADDDSDTLVGVGSLLRHAGCEVIEAADGRALLELLDNAGQETAIESRLDVIVTDIQMPRLTGLELLASLRRGARDTPVILMTSNVTARVIQRATTLGAVAVLSKPLDFAELQRVLVGELAVAPALRRGENASHPGPNYPCRSSTSRPLRRGRRRLCGPAR